MSHAVDRLRKMGRCARRLAQSMLESGRVASCRLGGGARGIHREKARKEH